MAVVPRTAPWGGGAGVSTVGVGSWAVGSGVGSSGGSSVKPQGGSPPGSWDEGGQGLPLLPSPWWPLSAEALPTARANDTIAARAISAYASERDFFPDFPFRAFSTGRDFSAPSPA